MKTHLTLFFALVLTYCTTHLNAQNLPDYLPADGLVGWWPFNGNANDESGNGNHGVVNGATLAVDRFGNLNSSFFFDGTNDNITATPVLPIGSTPRTMQTWIKSTATTSIYPGLMCVIGYGSSSAGLVIFPHHVKIPQGTGYFESGSSNNQIFTESPVTDGAWHQIVTTYGGPGTRVKLYLDGVIQDSTAVLNLNTASSSLKIGNASWANIPFNGNIDDVSIWNRALSPQEIQDMFITAQTNNPVSISLFTVPAFINYQAVARSANGDALANADVQVRFTLLADSLGGATEYSETHALTTNALGLFTTAFGSGTPEVSTFDSIAWDNSNKFLRVELNAGNGYIDMGTQQLLSVPFALRSQSAAAIRNENLPVFNDNANAVAAGLAPGTMYRTSSGVLMVVY